MPQDLHDPVLISFIGLTALFSIGTVMYLIAASVRGPLLRYETRPAVPWGVGGSILAILFVLMALATPWGSHDPTEPVAKTGATHSAGPLVVSLMMEVMVVGGFMFVVAVLSHSTPRDFGLSANESGTARDIAIGVVACVAAIAPVDVVQALLMSLMHGPVEQSGHPLVKMVTGGEPNLALMVVASIAAIVVAPVCEEFTFRVLLQGWLEKWEDERLGWHAVTAADAEPTTHDDFRLTDEVTDQTRELSLVEPAVPPSRGLTGLPYGWLPVIISALLFGLAHFGYGPEPVPLYFLGLVLGYVYQRTHRVVPCIVAHALFNSFTVFMLWRMVFFNAKP